MNYYKRRPKRLSDLNLFEAKGIYPYRDNQTKSDEFRAWMLKNKPKEAASMKNYKGEDKPITTPTGSTKWSGLNVAYDKFGKAFEKQSAPESDSDNTTKLSGKVYKDAGNKEMLDAARAKGGASKYVGKAIKIFLLFSKNSVGGPFFEALTPLIGGLDDTIPLHYQVLFAFMTLREKNLNFSYGPARRAMQEVAETAYKREGKPGGDFSIGYGDYYNAPGNKKRPTYARPDGSSGMSIKDPNKDNLYAQLSAVFGNCTARRNSDGTYRIDDQYDFNVLRSKEARSGKSAKAVADDIAEAIPTLAASSNAFAKFWEYLTGDKGGRNAAEYLEPLLLQMETQLGYAGVPTSMTTQKSEDRSGYEKIKRGVKGIFGREEDETLIPGIGIPFLEESSNKNQKMRLTRRQLNEIIKKSLIDLDN